MLEKQRSVRTLCSLLLLCLLVGLSLVACGNNGSNPGNASANGNSSTPNPTATVAPANTPGQAAQAALTVTSVDISLNPASLAGHACGSNLTVTYTATFHFPANNAGGQVVFEYTTNNGRGSTQADLTVPPGTTTVPYHFTWSGALPADHTAPGPGGVIVTSPNAYNSPLVGPSGICHP